MNFFKTSRWGSRVTGNSQLGLDAWGRQKSVTDKSLFHGMFTFDVPAAMWIEYDNDVESTSFTHATSVGGMLNISSAAGLKTTLLSKRHPRYQPNRGHLYATSMIVDSAATANNKDFGIFTSQNGVFFRVRSGELYAVRRTTINGVTTETEDLIEHGADLTKGNVYDIQMQWRGVGNIFFFVNQELRLVLPLLGTLDSLSISNPALPIGFEVSEGDSMRCGCVDISSEGGESENRQRGDVDSGEVALSSTEIPVVALKLPNTITYNGNSTINTRDIALRRVMAWADAATTIKVYYTRTTSKFTGTTWTDNDTIGTAQYSIDGNIVLDNLTTNLRRIATSRVAANSNVEITNPDPDLGEYFLTSGDYLIVTMQAKANTIGGSAIEWGAEI